MKRSPTSEHLDKLTPPQRFRGSFENYEEVIAITDAAQASHTESKLRKHTATILKVPPPPQMVHHLKKGGNFEVAYLQTDDVVERANEIFGYAGWSDTVVDRTILINELAPPRNSNTGKQNWNVVAEARVRVTLRSGVFHEDVGIGSNEQGTRAAALATAIKSAVSDGRKRALKLFGPALGLNLATHATRGVAKRGRY